MKAIIVAMVLTFVTLLGVVAVQAQSPTPTPTPTPSPSPTVIPEGAPSTGFGSMSR